MRIPKIGVDYELKLPKGYLSVSQVEMYLRCPMQYWFSYVQDAKKVTSSPQFEGTCLAHALEMVGRRKMEGKYQIESDFAMKEYGKFLKKHSGSVDTWAFGDTPRTLKSRADLFLDAFFREGHAAELKPEGVEVEFNVEIAGVPIKGVADVVEPNYIFDYKVYRSMRYLKPERSFQLSMYAHVFQKKRVGYIVFLKEGKKPIEVVSAERDLDRTRLWLECVVSNVAMSISNGSFAPCNPAENVLCDERWCSFFGECYGACS